MSVIARNRKTNKLYVLAKGAPELIHSYSTVKFTSFKNKIKELSLQGFRSIGLGLKQIS